MTGKIIVAIIGVLLGVATELFFPINATDPTARRQRHFWSIIFLIFSLVLGFPIEQSLETDNKIDKLTYTVDKHAKETALIGRFEQLDKAYDQNFSQASPVLRSWADASLGFLLDNWNQGRMPLAKEEAPEEIGKAYNEASLSIIATNVGSTQYYFNDRNYQEYNVRAVERGVPVIRFYLFSTNPNYHLAMRSGKRPQNADEFFQEVKDLHKELHSLYSAVIDVDMARLAEVRDVLIEDNRFAAETVLSASDWDPIRALATEYPQRVSDIRRYVHGLASSVNPRYTAAMSDSDVRKYFQKKFSNQIHEPHAADQLFHYLMDQLVAPSPQVETSSQE